MLWTMAVVLIILWMLGLLTGFGTEFFFHGLYALAVILLVVSINREVSVYRHLNNMVRGRGYRRANSGNIGL
jgi:hypothetical protein